MKSKKTRNSRIEMSKQFDSWNHLRMVYMIEEHVNLKRNLGLAIRFGSLSSINGSHETLGCESLPLSHIRSIEDGALKFFRVMREKVMSCDGVR